MVFETVMSQVLWLTAWGTLWTPYIVPSRTACWQYPLLEKAERLRGYVVKLCETTI